MSRRMYRGRCCCVTRTLKKTLVWVASVPLGGNMIGFAESMPGESDIAWASRGPVVDLDAYDVVLFTSGQRTFDIPSFWPPTDWRGTVVFEDDSGAPWPFRWMPEEPGMDFLYPGETSGSYTMFAHPLTDGVSGPWSGGIDNEVAGGTPLYAHDLFTVSAVNVVGETAYILQPSSTSVQWALDQASKLAFNIKTIRL